MQAGNEGAEEGFIVESPIDVLILQRLLMSLMYEMNERQRSHWHFLTSRLLPQ